MIDYQVIEKFQKMRGRKPTKPIPPRRLYAEAQPITPPIPCDIASNRRIKDCNKCAYRKVCWNYPFNCTKSLKLAEYYYLHQQEPEIPCMYNSMV